MKEKNPFKMHMHVCVRTHTHTHTHTCLNYLCSYLDDVKMLEILKHLALKPKGNEDGWEKPYFRSLSGFMLNSQHCAHFNLVDCFSTCKTIEQLAYICLTLASHEELKISVSVCQLKSSLGLTQSGNLAHQTLWEHRNKEISIALCYTGKTIESQ